MLRFDSCPNCFSPLNGNASCARCGYNYNNDKRQPKGVLEPFTILNGRYIVGKVLGKGGFGVTYVALDMIKNKLIAIKEYMPSEYSMRDSGAKNVYPINDKKSKDVFNHGREKFVEEARTLYKLKDNPIVVDIIDYFNENNTAYLVMEYLDGTDLRKMAKMNGGKIDVEFAKIVFVTVASALTDIHKRNILHRDLSPENIFVTKDKAIKLIDFGAARNYVSTQNKGMSILLKPGFAPPEQYNMDGMQGPWTDVYGLCATFYNVVSGKSLIDAIFRGRGQHQPSLKELGCLVTKQTSDVIDKGMALNYKDRYQDFSSLLNDIDISVGKIERKSDRNNGLSKINSIKNSIVSNTNTGKNLVGYEANSGISKFTPDNRYIKKVETINNNPKAWLGVYENNNLYKRIPIKPDTDFVIGRSIQNCDYTIKGDSNISRRHCIIRYDSQKKLFILTDDSSNGTFFIDNLRLQRKISYTVRPGYIFYLVTPNHKFVFLDR